MLLGHICWIWRIEFNSVFFVTDIRLDWDTYNKDYKDHKLIDVIVTSGDPFPLKDADGNEVLSRTIKRFDVQTAEVEVHKPDSDGASTSLQTVSLFNITPQIY